jgi:hypothetical protein
MMDFLKIGGENKVTLDVELFQQHPEQPDLPCVMILALGGINKTALSISKDSGFSVDEDTSIKIDNWSDILKYKEESFR